MKKTLCMVTLGFTVLTSNFAAAQDANMAFGGASIGQDTGYAYLGATTALSRNIEGNGLLLRASTAYANYDYAPNADDDLFAADIMAGYQQNFAAGRVAIYGGFAYENHEDNMTSEADGSEGGVKGQIDLNLKLNPDVSLKHSSSYSTPFDAYFVDTYLGFDCNKHNVTVGPELAFLGNEAFDQVRIGARIDDVEIISGTKLYTSAGYLDSDGMDSDNGAYVSVGFATRF